MFCYLIHNLPWGNDLQLGKRNVRTFIMGTVCYILLHALLYASKVNFTPMVSAIVYTIRRYFWWIVLADAISMSIIYKLYYGRNILNEFPLFQTIRGWGGVGNEDNGIMQPDNTIRAPPARSEVPPPLKSPPNIAKQTLSEPDTNSELNIDLLSENESSEPPKLSFKEQLESEDPAIICDNCGEHTCICSTQTSEIFAEDFISDIYITPEAPEALKAPTELDAPDGTSGALEEESPLSNPQFETKLTAENIDKYIVNRTTIENSTSSIQSNELQL